MEFETKPESWQEMRRFWARIRKAMRQPHIKDEFHVYVVAKIYDQASGLISYYSEGDNVVLVPNVYLFGNTKVSKRSLNARHWKAALNLIANS